MARIAGHRRHPDSGTRTRHADLSRVLESNSQLEQQAALGRYMLDVRHNLNNALTSVLGNSELMLLDPETLAPGLRPQVETIHNMTMRMNEILQRFSSLQKEMQLVEEQGKQNPSRGRLKSAGARTIDADVFRVGTMRSFTLTEAKRHFASILEIVQSEPVLISYRNRPAAVIVSIREYERISGLARGASETRRPSKQHRGDK